MCIIIIIIIVVVVISAIVVVVESRIAVCSLRIVHDLRSLSN
jgi:hypothetical protein